MKKGRHRGGHDFVATEHPGDPRGEATDEGHEEGTAASAPAEPPPTAPLGFPGAPADVERLTAEVATLNDRHLRLAAEYQNYRRRAETEAGEAGGRAQAEMVRRFLDVFDDLQRVAALDPSATATVQSVVDGVDLVERKFARVLEDAGVEIVDPAPGDRFDPGTMEAVMRVPAEAPADDDTVDQSFQRGYRFRTLLLRPARVSVRKHE